MKTSDENDNAKLGVSFHRTLSLSRQAIAQVLQLAIEQNDAGQPNGRAVSFGSIREGTSLGTAYAEAMPRYAKGAGLIDHKNKPTLFGEMVHTHDSSLGEVATQWVMHYHLSAPHRGGPVYWNGLVTSVLRIGDLLDRQKASLVIETILAEERREISKNTLDEAATAFLGTYSKEDALGSLGILKQEKGHPYRVEEPHEPSGNVFSYVLADFWNSNWPGRRTVNLESITSEPGGPASLMLLGTGQANRLLRAMQAAGYVEVQRRAAPYTVVRLWEDTSGFLERVYE